MKKALIAIVILAVLGAGGVLGWRKLRAMSDARNQRVIETVRVEVRDIRQTVNASGEVAPALVTDVKSEISGRVQRVLTEEGREVKAGDLLVELDRSEMESELEEMRTGIDLARLKRDRAERDFKRSAELHGKGFLPDKEYEDAETAWQIAEAELKMQEARRQTQLEKIAKASIRAPRDGIVLNLDVDEGEVIVGATSFSQGTVLMQVADLSRLIVKTSINEVDVARIRLGMPVEVRFDSVPDVVLQGEIEQIRASAQASEKVRVFPITVICPAADPRIKPGISAQVSIPIAEALQVPAVVLSAVFSDGDDRVLFVKQGGDFIRRVAETGISDNFHVELCAGAAPDEEVAIMRPDAFLQARAEKKEAERQAAAGRNR